MNKKVFTFIISWLVLLMVMTGVLYWTNVRLFRPESYIDDRLVEKMEFPVSRVTVDLKKDYVKKLVDSNPILCYKSNIFLSSSFKLQPNSDEVKEKFRELVNRNGYASKLDSIYRKEGFEWDEANNTLVLPSKSGYVSVPTWILYELLSDKSAGK